MRKIAGRPLSRIAIGALVGLVLLAGTVASSAGPAQKRDKKAEKVPDTLILVTTFSEQGHTLRGARVWLYPGDKDGNIVKGKSRDGNTNNMGEIPFHVPKTNAHYVLVAEQKGFERVQQPVHVQGEDQVDIFLRLPPSR
jgi:hypothetical protein